MEKLNNTKNLLTIAYNGTNYSGWQKQENAITIQETIEIALKKLFGKSLEIRGASRTDAGVHALGQRAVFLHTHTIPMDNLPLAINNFLPVDIRIVKAETTDEDFHPQYDAKNKTYKYRIYNKRIMNPLEEGFAWHVNPSLDVSLMEKAALSLIGTHDFNAFCAAGATTKTTIRTINNLKILRQGDIIEILINGNGFLYNMVRIISGTLAYVGYRKLQVEDVSAILQSKDRTKAGITAPPQGLTLVKINY
ncbi:MAG: tRNA pseudouridine(38-40) synthase TruA [Defluviitaleaceae bacterium]|nr:tRNA pseudouridine(38-40) synthase TruA [Defluviitaleaceae bacterium]